MATVNLSGNIINGSSSSTSVLDKQSYLSSSIAASSSVTIVFSRRPNLQVAVDAVSTATGSLLSAAKKMGSVSISELNIGLDADLWDEKHITDDLVFPGKVSIGSNLDDNNNSLTVYDDTTFNKGVEGIWSNFYMTDLPDDGNETYFLSDFTDLTDWTFTDVTNTLVDGYLNVEVDGGSPLIEIDGTLGSGGVVKIKYRKVSGGQDPFDIKLYVTTLYSTTTETMSDNDWHIIDLRYSGSLTKIEIDFLSNTGDVVQFEFIYAGTGKYVTKYENLSNYKIHGTITGCTPDLGLNYKGLRFNSNTDSITFDKTIKNSEQTICFWTALNDDVRTVFAGFEGNTSVEDGYVCMTGVNTAELKILLTSGAAQKTKTMEDFFIIDGTMHFYAFTLSSTTLSAYRDASLLKKWEDDYSDYYLPINKFGYIAE